MSTMEKKPKASLAARGIRFGVAVILGVLLPLAVLAAGGYGAYMLMKTAPQAQRSQNGEMRKEQARLVEVVELVAEDRRVTVEAMGSVIPARSVGLQARVGGEITSISSELEPGGIIAEGETILEIDRADYELAVLQREAALEQTRSTLELEIGQQQVAREEFELLGQSIPEGQESLVLRAPQLARAEAEIAAARAALEEAKLDLQRTEIKAPFNALVQEESVEVGTIATTSSVLARLVGTDCFRVELSVPVDVLRWIEIPMSDGRGSEVRIYDNAAWGPGVYRTGYVDRFTATLDEASRMARVLVTVEDPLALKEENDGKMPLLLGSYVRAEIEGRLLEDAVAIPRGDLHEGDTIWMMDDEGRLRIKEVKIAWRGRDEVLVLENLEPGARLVTTQISAPVEGMLLRTDVVGNQLEPAVPVNEGQEEEQPGAASAAAKSAQVSGEEI